MLSKNFLVVHQLALDWWTEFVCIGAGTRAALGHCTHNRVFYVDTR